eukprot:TRINITY_DN11675_c0_g1_i1.p1 TRINITY_DN11675_c0_g1~~TRINITY_DN11675_c0_g1_i1.p1  ORF type:complete len:492 (-),score=102.31 TRINITY_DN11675_c0_g1_i1:182-1657(-)
MAPLLDPVMAMEKMVSGLAQRLDQEIARREIEIKYLRGDVDNLKQWMQVKDPRSVLGVMWSPAPALGESRMPLSGGEKFSTSSQPAHASTPSTGSSLLVSPRSSSNLSAMAFARQWFANEGKSGAALLTTNQARETPPKRGTTLSMAAEPCSGCGSLNAGTGRFCVECGAMRAQQPTRGSASSSSPGRMPRRSDPSNAEQDVATADWSCTVCAAKTPAQGKFCIHCGHAGDSGADEHRGSTASTPRVRRRRPSAPKLSVPPLLASQTSTSSMDLARPSRIAEQQHETALSSATGSAADTPPPSRSRGHGVGAAGGVRSSQVGGSATAVRSSRRETTKAECALQQWTETREKRRASSLRQQRAETDSQVTRRSEGSVAKTAALAEPAASDEAQQPCTETAMRSSSPQERRRPGVAAASAPMESACSRPAAASPTGDGAAASPRSRSWSPFPLRLYLEDDAEVEDLDVGRSSLVGALLLSGPEGNQGKKARGR